MRTQVSVATFIALGLTGCAGKLDYIRPTAQIDPTANVKIVNRSRDAVWNASVPELGKQFFVINNLDKSSGLINISYNGEPEKYIDCGRITSYVKNARGERTYNFSGAKGRQIYEIMDPSGLFRVDRKMSLEGRINLVFEALSPNQTRVTANTRYVVQRQQVIQNAAHVIPYTSSDSISFNSGNKASFPAGSDGRSAECVATGALEREVLSAIQ